jgi:adenosine deaminase
VTAIDREVLRRLPKAELHCHLDGSVRPATIVELARESGIALPRGDAASLATYLAVPPGSSLEEYLTRFDTTLAVMQRAPALERIAYELAIDSHADGVLYLETRFAPNLSVRDGLQLSDVMEAVLRGLMRAERETGIVARVIVIALRTRPAAESRALSELAVAYKGRGVVGFDLAGAERRHPASAHAAAFEFARAHDLACTCHAGEGDGAESVRDALQSCRPNRIGHGTRIFEDPSLMDQVATRAIPVEVCLTSNVQTAAVSSYMAHPLRRYYDAGMNVMLNTDNRVMSATTLTDEFAHAAAHLDFSFDELAVMALNGFRSAFTSVRERDTLVGRAQSAIARLRAEAI